MIYSTVLWHLNVNYNAQLWYILIIIVNIEIFQQTATLFHIDNRLSYPYLISRPSETLHHDQQAHSCIYLFNQP